MKLKVKQGVIIDQRPTDYILGSSPVEKKILVPDGNWKPYKPEHEIQWTGSYDTLMCFPWNAEVLMEDMSLKKISEIKVGDYVITHNGNKKRVTETLKRDYSGELMEINISGIADPIVCTPNHPILTSNGWLPAQKIKKGNYVTIPSTKNLVKDSTVYEVEKDKDFLWFLGLFLAEGSLGSSHSICENSNLKVNGSGDGSGQITFSLSDREHHLADRVIDIGKRLFNTNFNINVAKNGSHAMNINGYNTWLRELLEELAGRGCDKKRINKRLMLLEPELQINILKGWLDGDGCYKQKGKVIGTSVSEELTRQMLYICLRNGIVANISKKKKREDRKQVYNLFIYGEYVNKIKDFGYKSKHQRNQKSIISENNILRRVDSISSNRYVFSKTSSSKQQVKRVYNLEVEDDHSYIVNTVAVHNCVSFSATDVLEYIFTHAIQTGRINQADKDWLYEKGYFKNGFINFSERFVGTLGETTSHGAYQYKVGDAIRRYGLIPQDMFPMAKDFWDNVDPKFITQEMYDLGAEFIKRFPISYEWSPNRRLGIKYAPLQVCVYYQNGAGIHCPSQNPNHAVEVVYIEDTFDEIGDSYFDEFKKYCPEKVYSAMLYTVNFKSMDTEKWLKDNDLKWVRNTQTGSFGRVLQGELKTFDTEDRAVLALIDDRVRENGVQVDNETWISLPKKPF